jgi:ABC-type branched-subunit amino acid transport system ATPase component
VSSAADPLLSVRSVAKAFGGVQAVDGCSFDVARGSITGLIGPNGSGKTTTFNLITGLEQADHGEILFDGERIDGRPPHVITRAGLGRTFQTTRVFPDMTVVENMMVAAPEDRFDASAARALELLEMVGLGDLHEEFGANLSYGQGKLVEIARVHMRPHRMVLLDEPFAGVNRTLAEQLVGYLQRMHAAGVTYLIIDHEMKLVMRLCDPVLVLDQGKLLTEGTPEVVQNDPAVLTAYFGKE